MNIIYDNKKKIMWDQLLIIIVAVAMAGAAAYAIYSSNRTYAPLSSSGANAQSGANHMEAEMHGNSYPDFDSNSSGQLQQGRSVEQGSSASPQEAGTSNPIDPNYCNHRFMECAYPAD